MRRTLAQTQPGSNSAAQVVHQAPLDNASEPQVTFQTPLDYWLNLTLAEQMGNIGSEISRTIKRRAANKSKSAQKSLDIALELFDLTIMSCQQRQNYAGIKEVCRAREEVCDYFLGDNEYHTDPVRLMRYYDGFVSLARPQLWAKQP